MSELDAANLPADVADIPTTAEFEARTLLVAAYFDPANDTVANVTAVGSVSGAVGSVTGAVGSVTGNVGGNVVGTVASVVTKTGYALVSTGLNLVLVDGRTLPAALQIIAAGVLGKVSGAGTGTEVFVGLDAATTRATVTVDASGNRSVVVYG
jgi:hypothetical protein